MPDRSLSDVPIGKLWASGVDFLKAKVMPIVGIPACASNSSAPTIALPSLLRDDSHGPLGRRPSAARSVGRMADCRRHAPAGFAVHLAGLRGPHFCLPEHPTEGVYARFVVADIGKFFGEYKFF